MKTRWLRMAAIAAASLALLARPAAAQQILRDAETEAFMADMSGPLVSAAGMEPRNVQVFVLNDPEINAFVAGGQYVWVHSGLIAAADNVKDEVEWALKKGKLVQEVFGTELVIQKGNSNRSRS